MRVFEPHQLTILTTSKCTAACRHCCMNSGPDREETLSWEQLEGVLKQAMAELQLGVVIFAGGEPMLLGQTLYKAIKLLSDAGVGTRLVTNAYWATSPRVAMMKLKELRAAGLMELNISTDDYHQPFIKLQQVRYAYEAALELDFTAVVLANCGGPESELTPEKLKAEFGHYKPMRMRFNENGDANQHTIQKGEQLIVLSNAYLQRLGRGVKEIRESELPGAAKTAQELDEMAEVVGGCPWAIRSAAISPKGHLLSCCGFEVEDNPILDYGDLAKESLHDLLDKADNDLLSNMIGLLGPVKLMRMLQQRCPDEVSFPHTYRSYCEACHDLVMIPKNREALYRHAHEFAEMILQLREVLKDRYQTPDGRVRLPAQQLVTISRKGKRETAPASDPTHVAATSPIETPTL